MLRICLLVLSAVALIVTAGTIALQPTKAVTPVVRPLVIAHRGASGLRPEHTRAAYTLAAEQGADFIELDVISTRDGELIVSHDLDLGTITDAAERLPDRGPWLSDTLTLSDIRPLRVRQRDPARRGPSDGTEGVMTLDEVIELAQQLGQRRGVPLGLFIETKKPAHFRTLGLPLEERLVAALKRAGLDRADAPVILQSFDLDSLLRLGELTDVPRMFLVSHGRRFPPRPWTELAGLVDGVAPDARILKDSEIVTTAHHHGLKVIPWTYREGADYHSVFALGVDGVITDLPGEAVAARGP
jgi:glycerophosphoryl diester phosphodiesterase